MIWISISKSGFYEYIAVLTSTNKLNFTISVFYENYLFLKIIWARNFWIKGVTLLHDLNLLNLNKEFNVQTGLHQNRSNSLTNRKRVKGVILRVQRKGLGLVLLLKVTSSVGILTQG